MVNLNGIPRVSTPARERQEFLDFKRWVQQRLSAPNYVAAGNIVQGGTISKEAGAQLTEVVQETIVVGRDNVSDDALNDRALVGSSVTALGQYMAGDSNNPANPYNPYRKVDTRAVLDSRPDPEALASSTRWAGVYLEAEDPALPDPFQWARLVGSGSGATLFSQQQTQDGPLGSVKVGPYESGVRVTGEPNPANKLPGTYSEVTIGATTFRLQSAGQPDIVGKNTARVAHDGDGILRLDGANGVLVNGAPISGGGGGSTKIAEYRCTGTKGNFDAANQDISTPLLQNGGTTAPGLAVPSAGALTITEPGIYSADYQFLVGVAVTGRSFVDIADANGVAYSRTAIPLGEDQATGVLSGKLLAVGDKLRFRAIQTSGASRNYTAIIRLIKHP